MLSGSGKAILGVVAALLLLQAVFWRGVCAIARLGPLLQRYATRSPAWARVTSLRGSLKTIYPRAYEVFAARFVPASFTGLPLTLMGLGALYAAALLGGLIDDLREIEGLVGLDHGVNAFFLRSDIEAPLLPTYTVSEAFRFQRGTLKQGLPDSERSAIVARLPFTYV